MVSHLRKRGTETRGSLPGTDRTASRGAIPSSTREQKHVQGNTPDGPLMDAQAADDVASEGRVAGLMVLRGVLIIIVFTLLHMLWDYVAGLLWPPSASVPNNLADVMRSADLTGDQQEQCPMMVAYSARLSVALTTSVALILQ
eukprot:gene3800-4196_t